MQVLENPGSTHWPPQTRVRQRLHAGDHQCSVHQNNCPDSSGLLVPIRLDFQDLTAVAVMLAWLKTLKYVHIFPGVGPAVHAITRTCLHHQVLSFMLVFIIVMLSFSMVSITLYQPMPLYQPLPAHFQRHADFHSLIPRPFSPLPHPY